MASFSPWHWLIVAALVVTLAYPCARILRRQGFSRWWVVIALIPYVNLIGLWVMAFVRWPNEGRR